MVTVFMGYPTTWLMYLIGTAQQKRQKKLSSNPIALIKCFLSLKYHSNCHKLFISVKAKVLPSSFDFAEGACSILVHLSAGIISANIK